VTFLNVELGQEKVDETQVKQKLLKHFKEVFQAEIISGELIETDS